MALMHLQHLSDISIIFETWYFQFWFEFMSWIGCKYHCHYEAGFIQMQNDMFMMCVFGSIWNADEDNFGDTYLTWVLYNVFQYCDNKNSH